MRGAHSNGSAASVHRLFPSAGDPLKEERIDDFSAMLCRIGMRPEVYSSNSRGGDDSSPSEGDPFMEIPVAPLTKLVVTMASTLTEQIELSPAAAQMLKPEMSSEALIKALADQGLNSDVVPLLANGLEPEQGVRWAAESAGLVADKLPPGEVQAMVAATAWLQGDLAAADLQQALTDPQTAGPGSWAAQAAIWTEEALSVETPEGDALLLAPKAIEGAVVLAAGVSNIDSTAQVSDRPQLPSAGLAERADSAANNFVTDAFDAAQDNPIAQETHAAFNKLLEPFVELGLRLAAGQS